MRVSASRFFNNLSREIKRIHLYIALFPVYKIGNTPLSTPCIQYGCILQILQYISHI